MSAARLRLRRRFGLDTPLPADRCTVRRALLRHLAEQRPAVVPLALTAPTPSADPMSPEGRMPEAQPVPAGGREAVAAGLPDLLLLAPGGRLVFVRIKTQAEQLTRAHRAFADLCRERAIPHVVVRSLPEARRALDALSI